MTNQQLIDLLYFLKDNQPVPTDDLKAKFDFFDENEGASLSRHEIMSQDGNGWWLAIAGDRIIERHEHQKEMDAVAKETLAVTKETLAVSTKTLYATIITIVLSVISAGFAVASFFSK